MNDNYRHSPPPRVEIPYTHAIQPEPGRDAYGYALLVESPKCVDVPRPVPSMHNPALWAGFGETEQPKLDIPRDAKATNPKDAIGSDKLPLHLVPDSLVAYAALAFLEGALKYGQFNWRAAGVRASIYLSAMERHMRKFKSGEWADEKTGVPHLASIIACCGIILDAKLVDKLNDDRPPAMYAFSGLLDQMSKDVVVMKQLFNGFTPHQYTIADSEACR